MNLLLYTESRIALARLNKGDCGAPELDTLPFDLAQALPDSLFEELGYYGALDEDGQTADDSFAGLLDWFAAAALVRS